MYRFFIIALLTFRVSSFAQTNAQLLNFELTIDQISEIRIKPNHGNYDIHPGLDMTIEELQDLKVQKVAKEASIIHIGYDLTLEELTELSLVNNSLSIEPDFDTSIGTLSKLSLKKEYLIDDHIDFPFDMSLETLMKLSVVD